MTKVNLIGQGGGRGTLCEARLRALLNRDRESAGVVATRGGKISRSHYARLFGVTPSALTRFKHTFAEFEQQIGVVTGPLRHLADMRAWLTAAYEARELEIRDGKLDRTAFAARFNLRGGAFMVRHPPIRALFEELDEMAERQSYLPRAREQQLHRVQAVLAGRPALNSDRMTINQIELAAASEVPLIRFRDKPFADALAARQAEIMAEVIASKIDPYVHGRVFPFSNLAQLWPTSFLERVGTRFKQIAAGMAQQSAEGPYRQLINALDWIGSSTNPHCRVVIGEAFAWGRVLSAGDWEDALFAYRDHLVAANKSDDAIDSSVDGAITALRTLLEGLSSGQIVPPTSVPLPGVKHSRRRSGHLRSVAEAGALNVGEGDSDYVAFARARFLDACKSSGTDLGMGESDEFIGGLAVEMRSIRDLPADPVEAIRLVLERRLDALRSRAAAIVEAAIEAHRRGRELLALAEIDGREFERIYLGDTLNSYERGKLLRNWFPGPEQSIEDQVDGVGNFLALINQQHSGIPPPSGGTDHSLYGQFFSKRYLEYGGLKAIEPMLILACCRFRGHRDWVFHEAGGGLCSDDDLGVSSRSRRFA